MKTLLDAAIFQINQKNYPARLADYSGEILFVGINYDRDSKQHSCKIVRM